MSLTASSLKDDDLASRMGLQPKELNKNIAVLYNDALVKMCVFFSWPSGKPN
jgi:transcription initiation factor IIE alpha subunit